MEKKVIISVDCESNRKQIMRIVDILDEEKVCATFFVVGKVCKQYPVLFREIAQRHQVESHTYSHVNLRRISKDQQREEILRGKEAVELVIQKQTSGFKAPYHWLNHDTVDLLNELNFRFDSSCLYFKYNMKNVLELAPSWFREWCGLYQFLHINPVFPWFIYKVLFRIKNPLVVSVHPHYSGLNGRMAQAFKKFIRYIKEKGALFVTFNGFFSSLS